MRAHTNRKSILGGWLLRTELAQKKEESIENYQVIRILCGSRTRIHGTCTDENLKLQETENISTRVDHYGVPSF